MDEKIYQLAEQIVQLHQKAYEIYLPLVEDVCSRSVSEDKWFRTYFDRVYAGEKEEGYGEDC